MIDRQASRAGQNRNLGPRRDRMRRPAARMRSAEPRIFGVVPPLFALALGGACVVCGVVAAAVGRGLPGLVLVLGGAILLGFAIESARRWPTSATAQLFVRLLDAVTSRLGFARAFAGTWLAAARRVVQLRKDLRALRGQRSDQVFALGEAAYAGDETQSAELRSRVETIDRQIEAAEAETTEALDSARERVERHRSAAQPTEAIAVEEVATAASAEAQEPPTEPTAPQPRQASRS